MPREYKPDFTLPLYVEVTLGKLKNPEKDATKMEDALYMAMKNIGGMDLTNAVNPIFMVQDGNIVVGLHVPPPLPESSYDFYSKHFKIPEKI